MKILKNFINNNNKAQRWLLATIISLIAVGVGTILLSLITLNIPCISIFIVMVIMGYFINKEVDIKL